MFLFFISKLYYNILNYYVPLYCSSHKMDTQQHMHDTSTDGRPARAIYNTRPAATKALFN
jgi:hypothetical protein